MMLHVWISWFGDSVTSTHSLSLLAGVLTVPDRRVGRGAPVRPPARR